MAGTQIAIGAVMPRLLVPRLVPLIVLLLVLLLVLASCRDRQPPSPSAAPTSVPAAAVPAWPGRILVDGLVGEWPAEAAQIADPVGDAEARFDVSSLRAAKEGDRLFVAFDTQAEANLYGGGGEGLVLVVNDRVRIDFRARRVEVGGTRKRWHDLGVFVAPSHAAQHFEIALDHAGAARVRIEGADTVAAIEAAELGAPPPARSPRRAPSTWLRLASLNTERGGIVDAGRRAAIMRLLRAADADVICLQELGGTSTEEIARALSGRHVYGTRGRGVTGNAIASRWPLTPIDLGSSRFAGALIASDPPIVVVSVHLSCCGHLGSEEDASRLAQARALTARLAALDGVAGDAPIVIAGDFNDVGSSALRGAFVAAGLSTAPVAHLVRPATFTWTKRRSRFPPATLDLIFHGRALRRAGGFVLDTAELDDATLRALKLTRGDSLASDHRLLVVDLARP